MPLSVIDATISGLVASQPIGAVCPSYSWPSTRIELLLEAYHYTHLHISTHHPSLDHSSLSQLLTISPEDSS